MTDTYIRDENGEYDELQPCDETIEENDLFSEVNDIKICLEHLNDKIARIESLYKFEDRSIQARANLDKFEDYMKNIQRMNEMVNELKGQVAIIRAAMNKTGKYQQMIHVKYKNAMKALTLGLRDTDHE